MMAVSKFEIEIGGKKLIIETGKLAQQSSATVTARMGDTVVMSTVTISKSARDIDFFPLMVDYEERYFAGGRIKGPRFSKREGRPPDEAVIIGRMIDRGIRPLFPQKMRNEVQVIGTLAPRFREDPCQNGREGENGRPHVKTKAVRLEHRGLAPQPRILFQTDHRMAAGRQRASRGQAAQSSADHPDATVVVPAHICLPSLGAGYRRRV